MVAAMLTNRQEAFGLLKPACMSLLRKPSVDSFRSLDAVVARLHPTLIAEIPEFLLHPVKAVLSSKELIPEKEAMSACDLIRRVVPASQAGEGTIQIETYVGIFEKVFLLAADKTSDGLVLRETSEDLKASVFETLTVLIRRAQAHVLEAFLTPAYVSVLGFSVIGSSLILDQVRVPEVRAQAANFLTVLVDIGEDDGDARFRVGAMMSDVFPGLASKVMSILRKHGEESGKVLHASLDLWSSLMTACLSDVFLQWIQTDEAKSSGGNASCLSLGWGEKSLERVSPLIEAMLKSLVIHRSWNVRLKLATVLRDFVKNCETCASKCSAALVETFVVLCQDEWVEVARVAKVTSDLFYSSSTSIGEQLQDSLHRQIIALQRVKSSAMAEQQFAVVTTVEGLIQAFRPDDLRGFLRCTADVGDFIDAVLDFVELDTARFQAEMTVQPVPGDTAVVRIGHEDDGLKLFFKNFEDEKVGAVCKRIFAALGACDALEHFATVLSEIVCRKDVAAVEGKNRRKEALLLLTWLLSGQTRGVESSNDVASLGKRRTVVSNILSDVLEEKLLELPSGAQKSPRSVRPGVETDEAVTAALAVELVGTCSSVMGPDFSRFLVRVLSPVMGLICHPRLLVRNAARSGLRTVSASCGFHDEVAFVGANVDYVSNDLILKFPRARDHPSAAILFSALIECSTRESLLHVTEVLDQAVENLERRGARGDVLLLHVMNSYSWALAKWFPRQTLPALAESPCGSGNDKLRELKTRLEVELSRREMLARNRPSILGGDDVSRDDEPHVEDDESYQDKKPDFPTHVKRAAEIMVRCARLLERNPPTLESKISALETIGHCIAVLAPKEYEDVFLPAVHNTWPSLKTPLLLDSEAAAVRRASFLRVVDLAEACGDFVRRRVVSELMPALRRFLAGEAKRFSEFSGAGDGGGGRAAVPTRRRRGPLSSSADYRFVLDMLSHLGRMADLVRMDELQVEPLLRTAAACVLSGCDAEIRERALGLMRTVGKRHPESVWHTVVFHLVPRVDLKHEAEEFRSYAVERRSLPGVDPKLEPRGIGGELARLLTDLGFEETAVLL